MGKTLTSLLWLRCFLSLNCSSLTHPPTLLVSMYVHYLDNIIFMPPEE
uniref:Uncharacterized protein n=1 Tax=Rhizophora mucronata TaxID=61149 RepID=A0A2P2QJL7_RHIMU